MHPRYQTQERIFGVGFEELPDTATSFADPYFTDPETLTGNTLHSSRSVISAFLKSGLIPNQAIKTLRYKSPCGLSNRIMQILKKDYLKSSLSILAHYNALKRYNQIKFNLRELLCPYQSSFRKHSKARIAISKKLCQELVDKYGSIGEASRKTHVPYTYIYYWLHTNTK